MDLHSYFLQFKLHSFRRDRDGWGTASSALADRIRAARKSLGLTQKQVAKRLGITEGTFFTWEAGSHQPSGIMVGMLSEFFGIEIGQPRNA